MRKLNITEDMSKEKKTVEATHITFNARSEKQRTINADNDDDIKDYINLL